MHTHTEFTELMSLVLDGEATEQEASRLRQHIDTCQSCASVWAEWSALQRRFEQAPMLMPTPGLSLRVMELVKPRQRRNLDRDWLGSGLLIAWGSVIAAFAILMAGVGWWCWTHPLTTSSLASSVAQILSGLSAILRALEVVRDGLSVLPLTLGVGFYIGFTALLFTAWVWLVRRSSAWLQNELRITK